VDARARTIPPFWQWTEEGGKEKKKGKMRKKNRRPARRMRGGKGRIGGMVSGLEKETRGKEKKEERWIVFLL